MKLIAYYVAALAYVNPCFAQELIKYKPMEPSSDTTEVVALVSLPAAVADAATRRPAVVLLHAGGGWETPVTGQYAKALNTAGFVTLEPRLFRNASERKPSPAAYTPHVYGALHYLAARPDVDPKKIAVAGFSHGGVLSVNAATEWAATTYGGPNALKFAAHAPFYPVCWGYVAFMKARPKIPFLPSDAYSKWTHTPVKIFAGGLDDYDDRDPKACEAFIAEIPPEYRSAFSVKLYPDATHGWDQPAAEFMEPRACKGRGCMNRNVPNAAVTSQGISELVEFMTANLR